MIQEILTFIVVGFAIVYVVYQLMRTLMKTIRKNRGSSVCSACGFKENCQDSGK